MTETPWPVLSTSLRRQVRLSTVPRISSFLLLELGIEIMDNWQCGRAFGGGHHLPLRYEATPRRRDRQMGMEIHWHAP